jgi:hypothetical protein
MVFTRDLRVHDNPALRAAAGPTGGPAVRARHRDPAGRTTPAQPGDLPHRCLADLDRSLAERGSGLVVRRGRFVTEVATVADETDAEVVHVSADHSGYAQRRLRDLRDRLGRDGRELVVHDGLTVVAPGAVTPSGKSPLRRLLAVLPRLGAGRAPRAGRCPAEAHVTAAGQGPGARGRRARAGRSGARASPEPGETAARSGCPRGCAAASRSTTSATTTSPATPPRACRRTSTSAASSPTELVAKAGTVPRRAGVRAPARVAGLQPPAVGRPARGRARGPATQGRPLAPGRWRPRRLARRPHGDPDRRRRDAPAACARGGCTTGPA